MKIVKAIFSLISLLCCAVGITLCWVSYAFENAPLMMAVIFTIVDSLILLFHSAYYICAVLNFEDYLNKEVEGEKDW